MFLLPVSLPQKVEAPYKRPNHSIIVLAIGSIWFSGLHQALATPIVNRVSGRTYHDFMESHLTIRILFVFFSCQRHRGAMRG
jgi:hypothetical protein